MNRIALLGALFASLFLPGICRGECGAYYGSIDALLWKPSHSPIIAGRQIGPDGGGVRPRENLLIKSEYDWGVRARIGYETCDFFLDLSYLYYKPSTVTESFTAAPGSVIRMPNGSTTDNLQSLESKLDWRYQNVDGRYGFHLVNTSCYDLYFFGNARWVDFKFSNLDTGIRTTPAAIPDTYFQETEFCGGGLGVGVGGHYDLFCGFSLNGSVNAMAIIGRLKPQFRFFEADIGNSDLRLDEDPATCIIPAAEFCFAVHYGFCFCGWFLSAEVGYELDYYFDIMRHNIGIDRDGADDVPQLNYFGAGFGGPFFRLSLRY